jgi:plasmid replication initiation protein
MLLKTNSIAQSNSLVRGLQKMTLREKQLLYVAMSQIVEHDKKLRVFTATVSELSEFMGVSKQNLSNSETGLEKICMDLLQRAVKIKQNNGKWKAFQWINYAEYNSGTLTIRLSNEIMPFVIGLKEQGCFTKTQLGTMLAFKSYYTTRLYELLKCDFGESRGLKKEWELTVGELREFFQTGKKYKQSRDLIKSTIKVAINEINTSSDIRIWNYKEISARTKGNPLAKITFNAAPVEIVIVEATQLESRNEAVIDNDKTELLFDNEHLELYAEICNYEFTEQQTQIIYNYLLDLVDTSDCHCHEQSDLKRANYLKRVYDELDYSVAQTELKKTRFDYFWGILKNKRKELYGETP